MSPFSLLILLIWILSLYLLVTLGKGSSVLLTFWKKQLLILLTLWIILFVSIFFFFPELRTEPRALRLLGKRSTTELNPQPQKFSFFLLKIYIKSLCKPLWGALQTTLALPWRDYHPFDHFLPALSQNLPPGLQSDFTQKMWDSMTAGAGRLGGNVCFFFFFFFFFGDTVSM